MAETSTRVSCPDRAALEVFVASGERDEALAAHTAGCEACAQTVVAIREENAWLRAYVPPDAGVRVRAAATDFQLRGYDIVRELHRGGQGVVYHAIQRSTRRDVAIKVLRAGPFAGLSDRARFDREIQLLAQLNHPNIVTIHDSGIADGSHYFVMDFVRGLALDDFLAGPGSALDVRAKLGLFAEICEAVNAAHLRGVIHRDLKPSNIMVEETGTAARRHEGTNVGGEPPKLDSSLRAFVSPCPRASPKILDFGLAKLASTEGQPTMMTLTGHFVGTPQWASPEQLSGDGSRVDLRSDVYSLGVILYQVLTGEFPYDVSGPWQEVASRIQKVEPGRLCRRSRTFDGDLETIVLKCLAKEPERRYETAGALARDIRHYLAGEAIDAKRESAWYVIRKTVRRYRLAIGAVAAVFVVVTGFAIAMSLAYGRARAAERATAQRSRELAAALVRANIEQGRAQGLLGNVPAAEDLLWRELLTSSTDGPGISGTDPAFWALLSLYARYPCRATFRAFDSRVRTGRLMFEQETGLLVSVSRGGEVKWREPRTLEIVMAAQRDFSCMSETVRAWTAGGELVTGEDGALTAVRVRDGALRGFGIRAPARYHGIGLSRDGARLAIGDPDGCVRLYSAPPDGPVVEQCAFAAHQGAVRSTMFLATRAALLTGGADQRVTLWNLESDPPQPAWSVPANSRSQVSLSPDEHWLLCQSMESEGIARLRTADGAVVGRATEPLRAQISVLQFSPDGARFMAGTSSRSELRIYDGDSATLESLLLGHRAMLDSAVFAPGGDEIVSLGCDNVAKVWELPFAARAQRRIPHEMSVMSVAFARERGLLMQTDSAGRVLATASAGDAVGLDFAASDQPVSSVALAPDERTFATVDYRGEIAIWDFEAPPQLLARASLGLQATQLSYHPDGNRISAACDDGTIDVWDVAANTHQRLVEHGERAATAAFSPDGRWLASGDSSGRLVIRRTTDYSVAADIPNVHFRNVRTIAFSPDSRTLATGGDDGGVQLHDASTGESVRTLRGHENAVFALAFRPDGKVIASGDTTGTVILWDAATGRDLARFKPHETMVFCLAFSPDGAQLASGSGDRDCVVLDLAHLSTFVAGNVEAAVERMSGLDPERVALIRAWAARADRPAAE